MLTKTFAFNDDVFYFIIVNISLTLLSESSCDVAY